MNAQQRTMLEEPYRTKPGFGGRAVMDHGDGRPVLPPPGMDIGLSGMPITEQGKPKSDAMTARYEQTIGGEARPVLHPDMRATAQAIQTMEAGVPVTGNWTQNVLVDAMWTIDQSRNAFLHVKDGAWKKIFNGTDAAFTALVTLASQARQTSKPIAFREESDGTIHEIYLW